MGPAYALPARLSMDVQVSEEIKEAVISYIKRRLAPKPIKIRADIEVTCFTYEGIDAIKVRQRLESSLSSKTRTSTTRRRRMMRRRRFWRRVGGWSGGNLPWTVFSLGTT